jgi:hypothetical protein
VDEAVKNGVCVSRIADHVVPPVDWELAGDDCRFSPVAFFEDFEEIMPCGERFETPVVKDEELHAPKRPQESGIAAIAAHQCEISEELGKAAAAGFYSWRTRQRRASLLRHRLPRPRKRKTLFWCRFDRVSGCDWGQMSAI